MIRPYHLAAPALVALVPILGLFGGTRRGRRIALTGAAAYATACVAAGLKAGADEGIATRVRVPAVFPVLHFAWGAGFWAGAAEAIIGVDTGGGFPPALPTGQSFELGLR